MVVLTHIRRYYSLICTTPLSRSILSSLLRIPYAHTSEPARLLNDLVDLLERLHELLVVGAADLVAGDQVAVDVVQLGVPLAHALAAGTEGKREKRAVHAV